MIRLTDKMGIFPAVNITNKQRNRNSPISPITYSSLLLSSVSPQPYVLSFAWQRGIPLYKMLQAMASTL